MKIEGVKEGYKTYIPIQSAKWINNIQTNIKRNRVNVYSSDFHLAIPYLRIKGRARKSVNILTTVSIGRARDHRLSGEGVLQVRCQFLRIDWPKRVGG